MATIQERRTAKGEKHYRALVRVKSQPVQTATFRRKTDARRWAERTESDLRRGRYFPRETARKRTLAELIDIYCAERLSELSAGDQKNRRLQLAWWRQQIGRTSLAELRPGLIAAQRRRLARRGESGSRRSPATQNRYVAALSAALTYAVNELEWLESNPARKVPRIGEPRGRLRILESEERVRFLEACRSAANPRLYPLVLAAISTGMRRGELLRLRWRDLDRSRGVAIVHQSKNNTRRAVPVPPQAFEALAVLDVGDSERLIFANAYGKAPFPQGAFARALDEAKIRDFTFHDCRHTAASYLAMSGATLAEIAEILGHKTLQMVKRYAHLTEQHTVAVSQRMAARFLS